MMPFATTSKIMTYHSNRTELAVESISDCLEAVRLSIAHRKPDKGNLGYPAALLLFCIVDAIGHHFQVKVQGSHIRLDVLNHPSFGLGLSRTQIGQLKKWFRNPLIHSGTIAPGVILSSDVTGAPFDFTTTPVTVRIPRFLEVVAAAWAKINPTTFDPLAIPMGDPKYQSPKPSPGYRSTATPPVSGAPTK